jgi:hypothetical protein
MRQFTIAAATVAIAALISAAADPASADYLGGGPRKQNGQCWKGSKGSEGFGFWRACPQVQAGRKGQPGKPGEPGMDHDGRTGGGVASGG